MSEEINGILCFDLDITALDESKDYQFIVYKLAIIGSDNGLLPCQRHAIIWTNAEILLIWPLGTQFSETLSEIHAFSLKEMHLNIICKMATIWSWPQYVNSTSALMLFAT